MMTYRSEREKLHKLYSARAAFRNQMYDLAQLRLRYIQKKKAIEHRIDQEAIDFFDEIIDDLHSKVLIAEEHYESVQSRIIELQDRLALMRS